MRWVAKKEDEGGEREEGGSRDGIRDGRASRKRGAGAEIVSRLSSQEPRDTRVLSKPVGDDNQFTPDVRHAAAQTDLTKRERR